MKFDFVYFSIIFKKISHSLSFILTSRHYILWLPFLRQTFYEMFANTNSGRTTHTSRNIFIIYFIILTIRFQSTTMVFHQNYVIIHTLCIMYWRRLRIKSKRLLSFLFYIFYLIIKLMYTHEHIRCWLLLAWFIMWKNERF